MRLNDFQGCWTAFDWPRKLENQHNDVNAWVTIKVANKVKADLIRRLFDTVSVLI